MTEKDAGPDDHPCVLHVVESWPPVPSGYATRSEALTTAQAVAGEAAPHVLVTSRQHVYHASSAHVPGALAGRLTLARPSRREQIGRRLRRFYVDCAHLESSIRETGRECNADLIHVHWSSGIGQAALRAARELEVPLVAEVRFDLAGAVMTETLGTACPPLERLLRHWFERHLPCANGLVTASYSLAELVRRHLPAEAPHVTVVPNGTDLAAFSPGPAPSALRRRLKLYGALVVGSTSKMLHYEGLDVLLRALARLRERDAPHVHALLVGDGPAKKNLLERARQENLPVTFTGRVPREQVPAYLRLMDLFAVPRRAASITRHASPVKVIEAMACGVPVVGSRLGDMPWMLAEGRGVLVEPGSAGRLGEALASLAADAEQRRALGRRARCWAEKQPAWTDAARRYDGVYAAALRSPPSVLQ